eukprot:3557898-Rhodomonas_salina.1
MDGHQMGNEIALRVLRLGYVMLPVPKCEGKAGMLLVKPGPGTARNHMQDTAFLVQPVLTFWLLILDFGRTAKSNAQSLRVLYEDCVFCRLPALRIQIHTHIRTHFERERERPAIRDYCPNGIPSTDLHGLLPGFDLAELYSGTRSRYPPTQLLCDAKC